MDGGSSSGTKARVFVGLGGMAEAVPFPSYFPKLFVKPALED
jgi:hypothetical protein